MTSEFYWLSKLVQLLARLTFLNQRNYFAIWAQFCKLFLCVANRPQKIFISESLPVNVLRKEITFEKASPIIKVCLATDSSDPTSTSISKPTSETRSTSHEANEESQVVKETEVEEEEEYDTDSDSDDPPADNDEEDTLDDLMFLRAVTTRNGRMVRVVFRE